MGHALSTLLRDVLEHYLAGQQKPVVVNPIFSGDNFKDDLHTVIEARLPLSEQLLVHQCFELREQALLLSRKGDMTMSKQFFRGAELLLGSKELSREGFLLGQSFYDAAAAYFDYRRQDFEGAISRIYEALTDDFILEQEYGYAILHLHRIQLVHNLMRINMRRGYINEALDTGYHLLDYIERKSDMLPAPTAWDSSQLGEMPADLIEGMFIQVTVELALALAGNEKLSTQDFFAGARLHTLPELASSCFLSSQSHSWLRAKQFWVDNDSVGFLREVAQFLAGEPKDVPWLWYALIADLVAYCCKLDLLEALLIRQQVARDAKSWKGIPESWRRVFSSVEAV